MGLVSINGKLIAPRRSPEVVSRSAILILSGALIGMTITQGELTGVAASGFYAGISGLLSFFALDLAARRNRTKTVRKTLAAVDSRLTQRLARNVKLQTPQGKPHSDLRAFGESSYLPVASTCR